MSEKPKTIAALLAMLEFESLHRQVCETLTEPFESRQTQHQAHCTYTLDILLLYHHSANGSFHCESLVALAGHDLKEFIFKRIDSAASGSRFGRLRRRERE